MSVPISKTRALHLFCLARQAERSIDFALSSGRQWELLREYYAHERLACLESAVASLEGEVNPTPAQINRAEVHPGAWRRILAYPIQVLVNRYRSSWEFSERDIQFILQSFRATINYLHLAAKPHATELVQMRMDLHACETLIEWRLVGVPELGRAAGIEHFCQAAHVKSVKMEDVCHVPFALPMAR